MEVELSLHPIQKRFKKRRKFSFCPNFILYFLFLIFSLVFTQALRSPVSGVVFMFMGILPFVSFLYMLLSVWSIKVFLKIERETVSKLTPVSYEIKVINESIFPFPFVETDIRIPDREAVRCMEKRVRLSLSPLGIYRVEKTVQFQYRGRYEIGLEQIYVWDVFKLFRITIDVNLYDSIFILPRRMGLDSDTTLAASDTNTDSVKNKIGFDRSEVSDIRLYQMGDSMKNIHWKLSSKTQDLMVKQYAMNAGKNVYIFCDLAGYYPVTGIEDAYQEDCNEYCVDGIIELTIAIVLRELRANNSVTLVWYDSRSESGTSLYTLQTIEDFDHIFKVFATAPLCGTENTFVKLTSLLAETQGITMVFVTSHLDGELIAHLSTVAGSYKSVSSSGAMDVYYFNPKEKFKNPEQQKGYIDNCKTQLEENGIHVIDSKG